MKILWVNPSFLDYRIPVYKQIFELSGRNFQLIYSRKRVPERVIAKIEIAIGNNAVGMKDEKVLHIPGKGDFANTDYRFPYQKGLYKTISKTKADLIIGEGFFQWTPMALFYAKLHRKKFIIAYERTAHTERNCPKWRSLYRKFISIFVDGYLVNGVLTKEYLLQIGVDESKIYIGGMSADSDDLANKVSTCTTEEQQVLKDHLSVNVGLIYLYVGQLIERKGVLYLLKAWKKHTETFPDDTLLIVGTGPLIEIYKQEFKSINTIKFTGIIDYDTIYRYYAIADVFVMPTLEDNWSLVVPEAMACGLPIACSVYNGCYPELVHDDINGKRFDPLNRESINDALAHFHKIDLKEYGNKSKTIENNFNSHVVSQKIFDACRQIFQL